MTKIKFYEIGCSFLIVDSISEKAIEYINKLEFDKEVLLDFSNCSFSYELSQIFDAAINKLKSLNGEKKLSIVYDYETAYDNQIIDYLVTHSSFVNNEKKEVDQVKKFCSCEYSINLEISEIS